MHILQNKWLSLLHHVQNDHNGSWGQCDHDLPLVDPPMNRHGDTLPWFTPDEPAMEALRKVVMERRWLESLKYYVNFRYMHVWLWMCTLPCVYQHNLKKTLLYLVLAKFMLFNALWALYRHTGALEAFHNLVLKYNPKRMHFR